jgi:hypothetical protein
MMELRPRRVASLKTFGTTLISVFRPTYPRTGIDGPRAKTWTSPSFRVSALAARRQIWPPQQDRGDDCGDLYNWLAWDQLPTRAEVKSLLEQAIKLDPGYRLPHSLLAMILRFDWHRGLAESPEILDRAFSLAKRGAELSNGESTGHVALSLVHLQRRSFPMEARQRATRPGRKRTEHELQSRQDATPALAGRVAARSNRCDLTSIAA